MKQFLSRIRAEAVVLYAGIHPEVRLQDIGLAVGFPETTAKSMVSLILKKAGQAERPRGFAAPSYDPDLFKSLSSSVTIDRGQVRKLLLNPRCSYAQAARKLGCCTDSIRSIAKELGIQRGSGGKYWRQKYTDAELTEFLRNYPKLSTAQSARKLGYANTWSLAKRLDAIGIPRKRERRGRPAAAMPRAA